MLVRPESAAGSTEPVLSPGVEALNVRAFVSEPAWWDLAEWVTVTWRRLTHAVLQNDNYFEEVIRVCWNAPSHIFGESPRGYGAVTEASHKCHDIVWQMC